MTSTDSILSPESTVTSLLASSGHLKSTLLSDSSRFIRYRDRQYESATEALDAYITDFQRSLRIPETSTGRLQVPKEPVTPILTGTRFRNKDVLKEKLTDGELDFINLPVGTQRRDPDSLSLTTDDLLLLPADGSMPVTRTSAYLSQRAACPQGHSSYSRSLKPWDLSASQRISQGRRWRGKDREREDLYHQPRTRSKPATQRGPTDKSTSHHYPRWLTSQKSDMDFSGITSIPDLMYPTWLKDCGAASDPTNYRTAHGKEGRSRTLLPLPKAPSWLGELEASSEELQGSVGSHHKVTCDTNEEPGNRIAVLREEVGNPTLRELRLQFTEQLANVEERERDANSDKLFRDDKIESLILKAERALASPSLGCVSPKERDGNTSPVTEDILDLDRSWDNPPVTFKLPVPVGGAEDQLNSNKPAEVRKTEVTVSSSSGYSSRKHPGPVEALKQMLFSLQAVEQRVTQQQGVKQQGTPTSETQNPEHLEQHQEAHKNSEPEEDYEDGPGGQSLQRALHHLGRLKSLVDDMNDRKDKELQKEKDV
ncbi:hypothetical protein AGOR_G00010190 [Albula goreensis]|uniref:Lung adenoma susceptibility protein 2 n=1 Tax=Albula goreensis TaxID=1534307 RepID=A0A8T3EA49_9TELE|nr:hypothetical protein AGOR_G00010190 [Albula goreensis]